MTKIPEAARRIGVAEAAMRAWLARSPDHGLGRWEGKAQVFDDNDLVVMAIWAALIRGGIGPPHRALATAKRIARLKIATAFAAGETITKNPPVTPAVAVPLAEFRRRLVGKPQ